MRWSPEQQLVDKKFFERHQRLLLWFANTAWGRRYWRIRWVEKLTKVAPNHIQWRNGSGSTTTEFTGADHYVNRIRHSLRWVRPLATVALAVPRIVSLLKGLPLAAPALHEALMVFIPATTSTFYPDADHVDGRVYYNGANKSFADIRVANGTDADTRPASANVGLLEAATSSDQYDSYRLAIWQFDTSAISTDSISSATLSIYGTAKSNGFTTIDSALHIVSSSPASLTVLAASDFQTRGSTTFGNVAYASFSTSGYNDITLNASGIANINKAGTSKFGSSLGCDINNTAPTWVSAAVLGMSAYYSGQAGTGNDPKLVVVHAPGGPTNVKTWDGLAIASVKTVDGLAIASVKSINGLT